MVGHHRIAALIFDLYGAAKSCGNPLANLIYSLFGQVAHFRAHGANRAPEMHPLRNNVECV